MADYYSLLSRAITNLPKTSPPSARQAIYGRARSALTTQLRSLRPQLPESDIAREERALDEAVARRRIYRLGEDRYLSPELGAAEDLVGSGALIAAVEETIGELG